MVRIKLIMLLMALAVMMNLSGFTFKWTDAAIAYHEIAERMRSLGYDEDNIVIQWCKNAWWAEYAAALEAYGTTRTGQEPYVVEEDIELPVEIVPLTPLYIQNGFTEADVDYVASTIYNEAGYATTERHKELVGAVVYNRVQSDKFPNSVYGVITQPRQYLAGYAQYGSFYMKRAMNDPEWEYFREIAKRCLGGEVQVDPNVVYQANFRQGSGVYEIGYTDYSVTYFCYA